MTYHVQFPGLGLALTVNRVAMSIGELNIPEESIVDIDDIDNYPDEEILVVAVAHAKRRPGYWRRRK